MAERPYTDAELDAGGEAVAAEWAVHDGRAYARIVLAAVLPGHDARVRADERARVAEAIAEDIADNPGPNPSPAIPAWWSGWVEGRDDAAAIARQHATAPTTEGDPHAA